MNAPIANVLPVQLQERAGRSQLDRLALGVEQRDGGEDAQRAQGDDERRQPDPRHQQAVERAGDASPTTMPMSSASTPGTPLFGASLAITSDDEDHDRADRQVDAGGEDDQGLADRQGRRRPRPAGATSERFCGWRKRSLMRLNTMIARTSTMAGLSAGCRCSSCVDALAERCAVSAGAARSSGAGVQPSTGLMHISVVRSRSCGRSRGPSAGAGHESACPSRSGAPWSAVWLVDARRRACRSTSAVPVLKKSSPADVVGFSPPRGELGDRLDAEARPSCRGYCGRVGARTRRCLTSFTPGAAAVDRDDR